MAIRYIDPRHGTHEPTSGTPARRAPSVRRTSTMDASHPEGIGGPLVLRGHARDLVTAVEGPPTVAAEATVAVRIEFTNGPTVTEIRTDPAVPGVEALVGKIASTGFRAVIDAETGAVRGSPTYLLLDEIPASTLVSGYAVGHAVSRGDLEQQNLSRRRPPGPALQVPDLCAGFQVGGVIMTAIADTGKAPMVTGPGAPSIEDLTDPWAWHAPPALDGVGMRRRRRIDVAAGADGGLAIDVFFRDSHLAPDGLETIVHEYTVDAEVDAATGQVRRCTATPRVLPWLECPQAAASAERLVGMAVRGLRPQVRAELVGPTTCTHLNDTLRGIEDVPTLAALLPVPAG